MAKRKLTHHDEATFTPGNMFHVKKTTFPPPAVCPKCKAKFFHYHCGTTLAGGQLADYASCINCGWDSIPRVERGNVASSAD